MREKIIEMLRKDMMGEHQAIIQYLRHAYLMGEGEMACEIEGIARQEMQHFDMLADTIVYLGGDPTIERDPVDTSPGTIEENMLKNRELERHAIDQYWDHIKAIDDPRIRRLLHRIIQDELAHLDQFASYAAKAVAEGEGNEEGEAAPSDQRLRDILNKGIKHEYTVILQYLYHSYVSPDRKVTKEMEDSAINEMQHMGWLAEMLVEKGGDPAMNHGEPVLTRDHEEMLKADIAVEDEVTGDYNKQMEEIADEDARQLLARIRDHEIYHSAQFGDLLEEVKSRGEGEQKPVQPIPSVGSLIRK